LATGYWLLATGRPAFSLVEIVIALAVISIGLIAVVGLIPQGVQSARDAADNTLAATIVQDTFNEMRLIASTSGATWTPNWNASGYPNFPEIYYDAAGTNQVTTLTSPDRYFHLHILAQPWPTNPNLLTLMGTMTWPDKAGVTAPLNTNYFFTTIANYQH
jgi:uncharacterized protein (TIGR02598 family)